MSIPYLPGWGDALQENLPALSSSLEDIIDPRAKARREMIQGMMQDPEKGNALHDLGAEGAKKLYGNKIGEYVPANLTPQEKLNRENKQATINNVKATTAREQAQTAGIVQDTDQSKAMFPGLMSRQSLDNTRAKFETNSAELETALKTAVNPYQIAQIQLRQSNLKLAQKYVDKPPAEIFKALQEGTLSTSVIQSIYESAPEAMSAYFADLGRRDANKLESIGLSIRQNETTNTNDGTTKSDPMRIALIQTYSKLAVDADIADFPAYISVVAPELAKRENLFIDDPKRITDASSRVTKYGQKQHKITYDSYSKANLVFQKAVNNDELSPSARAAEIDSALITLNMILAQSNAKRSLVLQFDRDNPKGPPAGLFGFGRKPESLYAVDESGNKYNVTEVQQYLASGNEDVLKPYTKSTKATAPNTFSAQANEMAALAQERGMTSAQIKTSIKFQKLPKEEQAFVLRSANK